MSKHDTRLAMPHAFAGSRNLRHILVPAEANYRLTKVLLHPLHGICVGVGPAEGINYSHLLPGLFVVGVLQAVCHALLGTVSRLRVCGVFSPCVVFHLPGCVLALKCATDSGAA